MAELIQTPEPHHNWWAGLVSAGLDTLRKLVKLDGTEDQAWQVVRALIGTYFGV